MIFKKYTVKVPATTANLGAGFDSLGLALSLYNKTTLTIEESTNVGFDKDNLIYTSFLHFFRLIRKPVPYIQLKQYDDIPQSRGLGSSAACIVTGLQLANLVSESGFTKSQLLNIATTIEGHPDNVAPAIMGGLIANAVDSSKENAKVFYSKTNIPIKLAFAVFSPTFSLETHTSRGVLPNSYSRSDTIFNISRASLFVSSMINGHFENLDIATQDCIHQPYRLDMIPGMSDIFKISKKNGSLATFLSGAGPSCLSILKVSEAIEFKKNVEKKLKEHEDWSLQILNADNKGVTHEIEVC